MDPKVEKDLADALEQLEEKIEPLQELGALGETLKALKTDLLATSKSLHQAAKPFPEALSTLTRVSDLLSEVSTLIKNSDPSVIADSLSRLEKALGTLDDSLRGAITDQAKNTEKAIQTVQERIGSTAQSVSAVSEDVHKLKGSLTEEFMAMSKNLTKEMAASSASVLDAVNRAKKLLVFSMVSSLALGAVIIGLLIKSG